MRAVRSVKSLGIVGRPKGSSSKRTSEPSSIKRQVKTANAKSKKHSPKDRPAAQRENGHGADAGSAAAASAVEADSRNNGDPRVWMEAGDAVSEDVDEKEVDVEMDVDEYPAADTGVLRDAWTDEQLPVGFDENR